MVGAKSMICVSLMMLTMMIMSTTAIDEYTRADFPADFAFGAGSSAFQVEGAAFEDGRAPSVVDTFVHRDSFIGPNGEVACDEYHKYKEDVQLMVETGLEAYRFSISWSRLIPNGRGHVNPKGLQYYNNLINELIKYGIQPHVTLMHFDTPQALEDEYNGWISRNIVKDFIEYADICFKEFGDRVRHWITLNEVNMFSVYGYDTGVAPPGHCSTCSTGNSSTEPYLVVHHMLLANSKVYELYKQKYQAIQHGVVGINIFVSWFIPKTQAEEDVKATDRAFKFIIGWIMNPLTYGDYPPVMKKIVGKRLPVFTASESRLIKGSLDFIGINIYNFTYIKHIPKNHDLESKDFLADIATDFLTPSSVSSSSTPFIIQSIIEYISQTYEKPAIYIHEAGLISLSVSVIFHASVINRVAKSESLMFYAGISLPGNQSLDTRRVKYIHGQIAGTLAALRNGSNVKGFFVWSFMDLYEFFTGYESGFGLYYVDFEDEQLRRYLRLSAQWYSNFLKGGGIINLEDTTYAS